MDLCNGKPALPRATLPPLAVPELDLAEHVDGGVSQGAVALLACGEGGIRTLERVALGMELVLLPWEELIEYLDDHPEDRCFLNSLEEYMLLDGHGTIGLEVMEDAPETDTIYVALGVGFLGAGTALAAKALKPSVKVVGVNSSNYRHFYESFKQGKPIEVEHIDTLADGNAAMVTEHMLRLAQDVIDDVVVVSEEMIEESIRLLALGNKMVVEGSGALSLAAALSIDREKRSNTVCILSGGSIDADRLSEILTSP